jgi:drug/metabolite transporter (DMT)-like permease
MIPATLIPVIANIASRFFDKKKITSKTNVSTAGGVGLIGLGITLIQGSDHVNQITGVVLVLSGIALSFYKEYNRKDDNEDKKEVKQ